MRPFQIFSAMAPERAERFFEKLNDSSPAVFEQTVAAAAAAMKARPGFLRKRPFAQRVQAVRRSLARVGGDTVAEELLAVYFLEGRKELLLEWLDKAGVKHEDGVLTEESPAQPAPDALRASVEAFRTADDDEDRELLLQAFSAQGSIDWPDLERMVAGDA
ncbi:MAG: hypothetical protein ACQGVK_00295 [Myxococcota bacterium]